MTAAPARSFERETAAGSAEPSRPTAELGSYVEVSHARTDRHGEARLRIVGALDALTSSELRPLIDGVVADRPRRVTLDLERLSVLDSSGVGVIVSLFKRVKAHGGELVVIGARDQPRAVLKLLRLDRAFGL